MFKKLSLLFLALAWILAGVNVNAQETQEAYLKLTHYPTSSSTTPIIDEFSLNRAEVQVKGSEVSINYSAEPAKNRMFNFDLITSFEFVLRTVTAIKNVEASVLKVFLDEAKTLHVEATEALGQVNVYSVTGVLVASQKTGETQAQINLSSAPTGAYIVKTGTKRLLIVKN